MTLVTSKALDFNGSTTRVQVNNYAGVQLTGDLTIEFMAYRRSNFVNAGLVDKHNAREFSLVSDASTGFIWRQGDGSAEGIGLGGTYLPLNTWKHIEIVRKMADMKLYGYSNGAIVTNGASFSKTPVTSTNPVTLGHYYSANPTLDYYFANIIMCEVRIYARAHEVDEALYNANGGYGRPDPADCSDLVLWCPLFEGGGTVAKNKVSGSNNGLITDPTWVNGIIERVGAVWDFFTWG